MIRDYFTVPANYCGNFKYKIACVGLNPKFNFDLQHWLPCVIYDVILIGDGVISCSAPPIFCHLYRLWWECMDPEKYPSDPTSPCTESSPVISSSPPLPRAHGGRIR
jgi:hypothetical protein